MCSLVSQKIREIRLGSQHQSVLTYVSYDFAMAKKEGTRIAKDGQCMRLAGQRGITLVELLVVVALLGFLALIATAQLTHIVQKNQLESAARDVTAFLQGVPDLVAKQQSPLWVRFVPAPSPARLEVTADLAGTQVLRQLDLPEVITFDLTSLSGIDTTWPQSTATSIYTLRCDTMNRATDPDSGTQLQAEARLLLTHVNMLNGTLTPKYGIDVAVSPVWAVRMTRR